jgi:hypothetical protein
MNQGFRKSRQGVRRRSFASEAHKRRRAVGDAIGKLPALILVGLLLSSGFASAGDWSGRGYIDHIYINYGWVMVRVPQMTGNPDGCGSTHYYALMPSDPNYTVMHGALLAAQLAGREVKFWVNGCAGQFGKFPHIESVIVYGQ